ncbi:MAG TPA: peptide chain release factor N(5)-glutamine methyltransferase [Alphaproteobacteria bacterium]|nr:peptide chain release factor N(5)-glutamine methyltransferase [Alphaproteobacteria bacterium]
MAERQNVRATLRESARRLIAAGIEDPVRDASVLLADSLGCDRLGLLRRAGEPLAEGAHELFERRLLRRLLREPVSRILGRREFWSLGFEIGPAVLDPRPDSETLVEAVLARLGDRSKSWRLLDLGTGSGCLLLALLSELPAARGVGTDLSPDALRLARRNAIRLGLGDRAAFIAGNWADSLNARFHVVLSNPPYIATGEIPGLAPEVRHYDPLPALDGGADGLAAYRRLAPELPRLLVPGGLAALECGQGQAATIAALLAAAGLVPETPARDLAGIERCVLARSKGEGTVTAD